MSIMVTIYGAEKKCASCVNLPSAWETKEWLEALLQRKYSDQNIKFEYIDIEHPKKGHEQFSKEIIENDRFYPLVTINGNIVAEGNPKLKVIYAKLDELTDSA
ncbi:disulfide oxidoreductase YuzD [Geomicrobium halophilum]|uniref:Disulfide oxidoreductase YuzD n=1 Tax=Geomicrobium halophilum TaxID=549000 RepID=A0A841Q223_9BACL|nr:DUF1462 family protein [Geomicrobium halophilum]MBB6450198.1 disulfide oxidoreductase YuzD [Geomicrobium halophilum]